MNTPMNRRFRLFFLVLCVLLSCSDIQASDYQRDVKPVLKRKCFSCHGALKQESNLRLDTVQLMKKGGDSGPALDLNDYQNSLLWSRVASKDESIRMPPEGEPLSSTELTHLKNWLAAGAKAPANEVPMADPQKHWAFQPLRSESLTDSQSKQHPIDSFVDRKLAKAGLSRSTQASGVTLVRRMFLDLHGLPPTPKEIEKWVPVVHSEKGRRQLIETLLASPRYGERMALFWLDLVRYADTHGFEVNTPRSNAWPYRDYIINAFNDDKPYDQFIKEQLAGDSMKADAATGFLVSAAVLLPGQIGKDDASKRLARQDELNEIIVGTSGSFLGLTMGCARCHDHKFDPFSQEDYYSFQAYFSGVEYGDRPIRDDEYRRRQTLAKQLNSEIEQLQQQLEAVSPSAFVGRTFIIDDEENSQVTHLKKKNGHGTNPKGKQRGYRDDPGAADRIANFSQGRYTWWTNTPGEDVFTWNPNAEGRFRVWISWGTHGSGVHTRDARYVLDIDGDLDTKSDQTEIGQADQYYFAGQTSGNSEKKPLWSGLQFMGTHQLRETSRLILRGGKTGTGITADVLVLQEASAENSMSGSLPQLRRPVSARLNHEKFEPIQARYVRFNVYSTIDNNRHEPCLDELEVFGPDHPQMNLAAAVNGGIATSSGNYNSPPRHRLEHINDGQYGNGRSWISNEKGRGWVQMEFPEIKTIDRVNWGRDREGKFKDRLPIQYEIAASANGKDWTAIATGQDRLSMQTPFDRSVELAQISKATGNPALPTALKKLEQLEKEKTKLEQPQMVYAGKFKKPEETFLLNRGDAEQPLDKTQPHIPKIFGEDVMPEESTDVARRQKLAEWIASPRNPLTARVMVNRIWQMHFGLGLVKTPSDFGLNGAKPSHPKMLDWLAAEFVRNDWSIKHLHRIILNSETYCQTSRIRKDCQKVDSSNRLLWRFNTRRLEAEAIRDCMLQMSGELNLKMGGPGFDFFKTRGGLSGFPPIEQFDAEQMRRMIYAHKIRMESVPVFGAFDCPDAGQSTPVRSQSTTAIQALNLFNSQFVYNRAEKIAEKVIKETGNDPAQQAEKVFRLMFGRSPSSVERNATTQTINDFGLATVTRAMLNSNEFLFIP